MKRIAIFCGSSPGIDPVFAERAFEVGAYLASQQIGLVYGGGAVGLMGALADGALSQNGNVIGVLPTFLNAKEIAHTGAPSIKLLPYYFNRFIDRLRSEEGEEP